MSLAALLSGVLNSTHNFAAAAAAPIVLNLTLIAVLVLANIAGWGDDERTGYALVTGVFIAGLLQFALLWLAAARAGLVLRLKIPRLSEDVRRLIRLAVPGLIAGGITQFNLLVATQIASGFDRAVSYLYYADRIYQLPLGVVGVAIGVVLLPDLSRKLRSDHGRDAITSQNRALELALFLTIPAAIAIITLADPIIRTIFEHGAFTPRRQPGDLGGADGVRGRASSLRHDQGVRSRLLCPRGYLDADEVCDRERGSEPRHGAAAIALFPARWHCRGNGHSRLGQYIGSRSDARRARPVRA